MRSDLENGDVRAFARAVRTLAHRGPDDERVVALPDLRAVLAFRRLSIIDREGGAQPMSVDGGQHLVFNGEIYNHAVLRDALAARSAPFRTHSDSEVLLQLLRLDGAAGLEASKGMFAFAFLDAARGELLLGRDRLGVKQLYYIEGPLGLFFASEPKALLALPWVRAELDASQLGAYFRFRCAPSPATLFRGIKRLPAGTVLRVPLATLESRVERFWTYPDAPESDATVPLAESVDQFEAALLESVRRRLVSDVPVGAFLSGGLDSALVVAAMRRLGHRDLQTFTATFPGWPEDEGAFARRVSHRFSTRHHETPVTARRCLIALPHWVELNDDLVADASSIPLLLVSHAARGAGCSVVLAGEGADELFGGYGAQHKYVLLHRLAGLLPRQQRRERLVAATERMGVLGPKDAARVREYFVRRASYMGAGALAGVSELSALLEPDAFGDAAETRAAGAALEDLCRFDFSVRIPDDLLVRTDRATMGASVEARVPFLDHDLIALVNRLPRSARMLPGVSKTVPRLLARRWGVPLRTILHRKVGFQLPLAAWFRGPLRGFWDEVLRDRAVPGLRYDEVARLVAAHNSGHASHEELLWRVAALESWHRRWIIGDANRAADASFRSPHSFSRASAPVQQ